MQERYKRMMDSIEPSEMLQARLKGLKAPKWRRHTHLTVAALAVLALGVGAFTLLGDHFPAAQVTERPAASEPATGEVAQTEPAEPDIAVVPDNGTEPAPSGGGYEVTEGETVSYFCLPYIAFGEKSETAALDYDIKIPDGGSEREVTADDITLLAGSEDALTVHLDWGGLNWSGRMILDADGAAYYLNVSGASERCIVNLELLAGENLPPSCLISPADAVTDVWGVNVTGYLAGSLGQTGEDGTEILLVGREIAFVANGAGYRLTVYAATEDEATLLCSRFARLAITEGLNLSLQPLPEPEPAAGPERGGSPAYDPYA